MHQQLMPLIHLEQPALDWMDWQLMPNKFPGDTQGPMASLFHAIMSGSTASRLVAGKIRVMTLSESEGDHGSILADNIAGLLREKLSRGGFGLVQPAPRCGTSILWEIWQTATS
jgi:hypothetical protein